MGKLGRPKGAKGFARLCRDALHDPDPQTKKVAFEVLCKVARDDAHPNYGTAIKIMVGRAYGKELSLVELTGKDGAPLFGQQTDEQLRARLKAITEKVAAAAVTEPEPTE